MKCDLIETTKPSVEHRTFRCSRCAKTVKARVSEDQIAERLAQLPPCDQGIRLRPVSTGPGTYLHDAIVARTGEGPTKTCGCKNRIRRMNVWGSAGCREHLEEIIGWLVAEAKRRGWWKLAVAVPGSRYFIKRMVAVAIENAEELANM